MNPFEFSGLNLFWQIPLITAGVLYVLMKILEWYLSYKESNKKYNIDSDREHANKKKRNKNIKEELNKTTLGRLVYIWLGWPFMLLWWFVKHPKHFFNLMLAISPIFLFMVFYIPMKATQPDLHIPIVGWGLLILFWLVIFDLTFFAQFANDILHVPVFSGTAVANFFRGLIKDMDTKEKYDKLFPDGLPDEKGVKEEEKKTGMRRKNVSDTYSASSDQDITIIHETDDKTNDVYYIDYHSKS